jgi:hypothetical protein
MEVLIMASQRAQRAIKRNREWMKKTGGNMGKLADHPCTDRQAATIQGLANRKHKGLYLDPDMIAYCLTKQAAHDWLGEYFDSPPRGRRSEMVKKLDSEINKIRLDGALVQSIEREAKERKQAIEAAIIRENAERERANAREDYLERMADILDNEWADYEFEGMESLDESDIEDGRISFEPELLEEGLSEDYLYDPIAEQWAVDDCLYQSMEVAA